MKITKHNDLILKDRCGYVLTTSAYHLAQLLAKNLMQHLRAKLANVIEDKTAYNIKLMQKYNLKNYLK